MIRFLCFCDCEGPEVTSRGRVNGKRVWVVKVEFVDVLIRSTCTGESLGDKRFLIWSES
jgi:hypothetical protein